MLRNLPDPEERRGPRLGGVALDGAIPFVTSPGQRPLTEAILYRVFKAIPRVVEDSAFQNAHRLATHAFLLEEFLLPSSPMEVWEWICSMTNSRRRKALLKAWHDLTARGDFHAKFREIAAFVKAELLPYFAQTPEGPDVLGARYVARLIQAPHDETHVVAGPYLKPLVKRLKEVWNKDNWIFYASVAPEKLDQWVRRHRHSQSWFAGDYSAYDATYSRQAWELIESFYRKIYPDAPAEFWDVLDIWRAPHGVVRLRKENVRIEYQAEVCNASGRDDTALANAILNGIVLSISIAAALSGKHVSEVEATDMARAQELCAIAVVGDDSLVACSFDAAAYAGPIERGIEAFGLKVKAQHSDELCDMTFLGMMVYPVAGELYWGPTIGRRLYKAFWQADPIGHLPAWTKGVAEQLCMYANVPILYDLALKVKELLPKVPSTKVRADEHQVWKAKETVNPRWDDQTLEWVCRRFRSLGVTRGAILRDLAVISSIQRLPAVAHLEVPLLACCFEDL